MAEPSRPKARCILIVEDEYLLAADLAQSLEDTGANVLGPAASVGKALELIGSRQDIDCAVLDVNLGSEKVYPVAQALRHRGVRFVFATSYDDWIIPIDFRDFPRLEKPIDTTALLRVLCS